MKTTTKAIICLIMTMFLLLFATAIVKGDDTKLDPYRDYLNPIFSTDQIEKVIAISDQARDKDHFIARFGAICSHEQGNYESPQNKGFREGSKYLCGRLKKELIYKDFDTQLQGWIEAYNKYWYKHTTVDGRLVKSKYCTSDVDGDPLCSDRRVNVPIILSRATFYNGQVKAENNQTISNLPKPTKICRHTGTIGKDEYIQVDRKQNFFKWIKDMWIGDTVWICKDL